MRFLFKCKILVDNSSIFTEEQSKRIQERMEQIHHFTLYISESLTTWYSTYCSYQVNICLSNYTKNTHLHSAHIRFWLILASTALLNSGDVHNVKCILLNKTSSQKWTNIEGHKTFNMICSIVLHLWAVCVKKSLFRHKCFTRIHNILHVKPKIYGWITSFMCPGFYTYKAKFHELNVYIVNQTFGLSRLCIHFT